MFRLTTLLFFSCFLINAGTPEEEGLRIAKLTDEATGGFVGEYAEMEMVLINAHGDQTTRKLVTDTTEVDGDGDRSISTFLWPADVKGTRMLTWSHKTGDDDQWLFLPALNRVKRISSRNKSSSFMGSEFSYEDLGSQEVEEYTYKSLGDDKVNGRDTWLVERKSVSKRSGYSKEEVWYDKEYKYPVRVRYYNKRGDLLKESSFKDFEQIGKFWRPRVIHMENKQTKKQSTLTWTKREMGKSYADDHFSSDNLSEN